MSRTYSSQERKPSLRASKSVIFQNAYAESKEAIPPVSPLCTLHSRPRSVVLFAAYRVSGWIQVHASAYRGRPEAALLVVEIELGGVEELAEEPVGDRLRDHLDARAVDGLGGGFRGWCLRRWLGHGHWTVEQCKSERERESVGLCLVECCSSFKEGQVLF